MRVISKAFKFAPVLYCLGVLWLLFHFKAVVNLISNMNKGVRITVTRGELYALLFAAVYVLSLFINSFTSEADRVIASLYNLSFWLLLVPISLMAKKSVKSERINFYESSRIFLILIVFLSISSLVFFAESQVNFPSVFNLVFTNGLPDLIKDSTYIQVFYPDFYEYSTEQRLSLFSPYPTAFAQLVLCLFFFSTLSKIGRINKVVLWLASLVLIYYSRSRGVLVSFCLMTLFYVYLIHVNQTFKVLILILMSMASLFSLVFLVDEILNIWNDFNSLRENSSSLRLIIYGLSIEHWLSNNIILGVGIKPRLEQFFIPLGSHSTMIGLIMRTGIIGFFFYSLFVLYYIKKCIKKVFLGSYEDKVYVVVFVSFIIFMLFEDIDAPQILFLLFSLTVGFLGRGNKVND